MDPDARELEARLAVALRLVEERHHDQAEARLRALVADYPQHARVRVILAEVLHRLGRRQDAIATARDALQLEPRHIPGMTLLGLSLAEEGQLLEAEEVLRAARDHSPADCVVRYNYALVLRQLGDMDGYEEQLYTAVAQHPGFAPGYLALMMHHLDQDALERGEEVIARGTRVMPSNSRMWNGLGIVRYRQERFEEACAAYERGLKYSPRWAELHVNLANAQDMLGQVEASQAAYQRALDLEPEHLEAHLNLAISYRRRGELETALPHLTRALAREPDHHRVVLEYAWVLHRQGRTEEAVEFLAQRAAGTRHPRVWQQRAVLLKGLGRMKEAVAAHLETTKRYPLFADGYARAADLLEQMDQPQRAIEVLEQALRRELIDGGIYGRLARLHLVQGQIEMAGQLLERAADVPDGHPWILQARAGLVLATGADGAGLALDLLEQAVERDESMPARIRADHLLDPIKHGVRYGALVGHLCAMEFVRPTEAVCGRLREELATVLQPAAQWQENPPSLPATGAVVLEGGDLATTCQLLFLDLDQGLRTACQHRTAGRADGYCFTLSPEEGWCRLTLDFWGTQPPPFWTWQIGHRPDGGGFRVVRQVAARRES